MRGHTPRTRAAGYTLIEMLTLVMVIGIIAALAVPMLGGTANSRLVSAARLLAADIDHARIASITRADRPAVVVFAEDGGGYHIAYDHARDEPIGHPIDHGPYMVRFGQGAAASLAGVTITAYEVDDHPTLAFGRFGELKQPEQATITLTADHRSVTLTVDPTSGEVKIGPLE